jgi:hypothetical protein
MRTSRIAAIASSWIVAVAALTGCAPTVGDSCATDAACGASLFCDLATPGGYCTVSPCRVGECPEEAVCVDFGTEASYCMRRCDDGQGCREGLSCRTDVGDIAFCGVAE